MTVEELIKEKGRGLSRSAYVVPEIPEKKLNNAIVGMTESSVEPEYVVAIIDTTIFGKSDDGFLFTGESMYWHPGGGRRVVVKFSDLKSAEVFLQSETDSKGKVKVTKFLRVYTKQDEMVINENFHTLVDMEAMANFLNEVVKLGEESEDAFESTKQVLPLCDSGPEIKIPYVKIVANFAFDDDGAIDGDEFAAIYNLMVRNDFTEEDRVAMRSYMFDSSNITKTEDLISELEEKVPSGSFETISISLVKDCVYLYHIKGNELSAWKDNQFIRSLAGKLKVSDDKIGLIVDVIQNDEDILKKRKSDSELEKTAKDIVAKAAAVGVPIAAVYFSGSVIGLSAAGITSGLASIGLGFGMVGGIGVAVLVGVGAYKAVKHFTGASEVEACKQRELMIQNIIRNNQKTINYLVGDTNMISAKLFESIEAGNANKEMIAKLKKCFAMLNKAASSTTCGLISSEWYELYPETIEVKKRSDGTEYEEKTYPMDDSFKYENYERVLKILRAVEYLPKD